MYLFIPVVKSLLRLEREKNQRSKLCRQDLFNPRELALPVSRQIVGFANLCEHAALKEREKFSLFDLGVVIVFSLVGTQKEKP